MRSTITALQMGIRVVWVVQLALGVVFWTGNTQAVLTARAGVEPRLVAVAAVWGLIVPIVGLTQTSLLTGSLHWLIQVIHLLLGLGLIALAEQLATRAKARLAPVA
jgi:hypothetical protein